MKRPLLSSLVVALLLAGCGGPPVIPPGDQIIPPGDIAASSKQRVTLAGSPSDLAKAIDGNADFAADLYRELAAKHENLAFSPYSISTALAMTYAGAGGDTLAAFEKTLHIGLPPGDFHRAMNTLDLALTSRGQGAQGKDGKPFRLNVNNQLFAQQGFALLPDFLDVLALEYGAAVRLLDFRAAPEPSRQLINGWVSGRTEGLIPELLPPGTITTDTRLTLVNTIYFNAAWKNVFDPASTSPGTFTLLDGTTKQVPMMAEAYIAGAKGQLGGVEVIELPYDGGEVSMLLLVPPAGQLAALEQSLSAAKLKDLVGALQASTFGVRMPKFEVRTQAPLGEILTKLGLGVAFGGQADFSGMTGTRELQITAVVHEAVVKTDEAGTEAAAATGVVVGVTSVPSYVEVNRPFLFLVRDVQTGAIAFLGRIANP